jgi:hypothetical protein
MSRMTTAEQGQLALIYGNSLLRRMAEQLMRRQDEQDEIRVALCMRPPPIFAFSGSDVSKVVTVTPVRHLSGEHQSIRTLRGEAWRVLATFTT